VTIDRSHIRVKAMLIAPDDEHSAHAVSLNRATAENPKRYHRLIGGSVELGETHRDAIVREVYEELGAKVRHLTFLYTGRLDPEPASTGACLIESDGTAVPVVWRSFHDEGEPLPLYPVAASAWLGRL
jgi:8-oxo-dGTP pyrophosphatase MutT (NUDIX family)